MINVTKDYKGNSRALNDFSLSITLGETVGLAGPNGAGKTTTLRLLATLLKPTSGQISICGLNPLKSPEEVRRRVGYLPEQIGFYKRFSGIKNLEFYLQFYGLDVHSSNVRELAERFQLIDMLSRPVGKYSYGMIKKLGLIRIFSCSPDVLLLDEPMNGLDVEAQITLKELLQEFKTQGKCILLSTHLLHDIGDICNRVVIINSGKKLADRSINDIKSEYEQRYENFDLTNFYLKIIKGNEKS